MNEKALPGQMGAGSVHHIAFRNTDDADQLAWHKKLSTLVRPTPVQERDYFRSVYFREPGGVLFEIATDIPGFLIDEVPERLGEFFRSQSGTSLNGQLLRHGWCRSNSKNLPRLSRR